MVNTVAHVNSKQTYGAYVGDSLPVAGGSVSLGGGVGQRIAINYSTTPDLRIKVQTLPPPGYSGVAGVFSDIAKVATGQNGEPAHRPFSPVS